MANNFQRCHGSCHIPWHFSDSYWPHRHSVICLWSQSVLELSKSNQVSTSGIGFLVPRQLAELKSPFSPKEFIALEIGGESRWTAILTFILFAPLTFLSLRQFGCFRLPDFLVASFHTQATVCKLPFGQHESRVMEGLPNQLHSMRGISQSMNLSVRV